MKYYLHEHVLQKLFLFGQFFSKFFRPHQDRQEGLHGHAEPADPALLKQPGLGPLNKEITIYLSGLLAVHDWLHPDLPVPGDVRVHGGIHLLPYPLGSALRVAAAFGFARSPRLLRGLVG